MSEFGYFFNPTTAGPNSSDAAAPSSSIVQFQKGVFRTNCIDCLDRTNVVQSLLATENLKEVLKRMAILSPVDDLMKQANFQVDSSKFPFAFRNHSEKKHFFSYSVV